MTCYFDKNCQATEVLVYYVYHNEKASHYDIYVLGKENHGPNFLNRGYIILGEEEMDEVMKTKAFTVPEQLIANRMQIVSNQLCKQAGINHLHTALHPEEWEQIQQKMQEAAATSSSVITMGNKQQEMLEEEEGESL